MSRFMSWRTVMCMLSLALSLSLRTSVLYSKQLMPPVFCVLLVFTSRQSSVSLSVVPSGRMVWSTMSVMATKGKS